MNRFLILLASATLSCFFGCGAKLVVPVTIVGRPG